MPVRCAVSRWQITLITTDPETTSPRRVTLIFQIDSVTGNDIRGRVFNTAGTTTENFTGECRVLHAGDVNRMSFAFPWGGANFDVRGVAFTEVNQPNTFVGSFVASARTDLRKSEKITVAAAPPDPGDTGVGNGTQT